MSNYEEATTILKGYVSESAAMMANAHATLALVDEMRAARQPESNEIFTVCIYWPDRDVVGMPLEAFKDRTVAHTRRDELNQTATNYGVGERYVVKVLEAK